ncbi:hypothetical protein NPIL_681371 [Nephila pilipes]|uniref:Uncharacterized protein n=1 Tax=Nephila pilipes TaxID=299642 RepID=A0A8X6T575_NEPPI|nr:hypothetical protein NPIL_681371 [Nephila pilipes]
MSKTPNQTVLLSTAFIDDAPGRRVRILCILDNGSNINCLPNECVEILGLKRKSVNVPVSGLKGSTHSVKAKISGVISNADESFRENRDFFSCS